MQVRVACKKQLGILSEKCELLLLSLIPRHLPKIYSMVTKVGEEPGNEACCGKIKCYLSPSMPVMFLYSSHIVNNEILVY